MFKDLISDALAAIESEYKTPTETETTISNSLSDIEPDIKIMINTLKEFPRKEWVDAYKLISYPIAFVEDKLSKLKLGLSAKAKLRDDWVSLFSGRNKSYDQQKLIEQLEEYMVSLKYVSNGHARPKSTI